ncbi:2Fe-2S iron-sulfur cluster binding domain-containing protein [Zoogloea sp.]|uniref:2Fe-2S iron-sulfur cluster binding domain-containing protein n=1 Tax=Zoogloea sp. TaxID=49181 RepID=UPI001AC53632|nr:2Fe-2S iron-sulfur cluster binding domain-containing protein [Zoogloea sp.]MBN8284927.1 2Fe-2S iron-sulfur cluster binding domain-containing protein [Zoogloea sp.]
MNDQTHQVTLRFADGATHTVLTEDGRSVLDAALQAGAPVIHQCHSGSCSSCIATLCEGSAVTQAGATTSLLSSEYAAGQRLLCVTRAQSDCVFELPYTSTAGQIAPVTAHAFVDGIERIASNVMKLTLELAEGDWLDFRPGQYLQVEIPGAETVRSYSPSSIAADLPRLELLVRLLPGGAMSSWLEGGAKPDDVVKIKGPYGAFFLREDHRRAKHIFVAGGTGLAPVLSMVDGIRQWGGRKPPMLLSFGCAVPEALFCLDELELRRQWLPTLETRISVDRGAQGDVLSGSPVAALREGDVPNADTVAYLCGPQPMIDAATRRLIELGVPPERIYSEQFVASH